MNPVESILQTTMTQIKSIVDVNTIVGDPIYGEGGSVVIPVSKVGLGFVAGGGDFPTATVQDEGNSTVAGGKYPFLGASVVGVTITPKAFLCLRSGQATLLHADCDNSVDRLVQLIPSVAQEVKEVLASYRKQNSCHCCEDTEE